MSTPPLLLASITDAGEAARGRVAISGSHGGRIAGALASAAGLRAVVLHDAGIGLDRAGVRGVEELASVGLAAAAADGATCRIGDADEMAARGLISLANAVAGALGVRPGMPVAAAAGLLSAADPPRGTLPPAAEARGARQVGAIGVVLVDSASLAGPQDAGAVVVTGSHGGLVGGDAARALKADARLAAFNDAGMGPGGAGAARLPALEGRGVAAVTVSHESARIGEAASTLETGRISAANAPARALGARVGDGLAALIARLPAGR